MPNDRLPTSTVTAGTGRESVPPEECQICSYKFTQRRPPHRATMSICACRSGQPCLQHTIGYQHRSTSQPSTNENERPVIDPARDPYLAMCRLMNRDPDKMPRYPCTLTCGHTICEPCAGECVVLDSKIPHGLLLEVVRYCQRVLRPPELVDYLRPRPRCPLCRALFDILDWPIEETLIALNKRLLPLMFYF